jgi:Cytochrome c554 and c-prime
VGHRTAALYFGVVASVTLAAYAAQPGGPTSTTISPRPFGAKLPDGKWQYSTTMSCAAASCHGSGQIGHAGGEFSTWGDSDPHRRAYRVLYNEDSVRISKNLGRKMPAHEDSSCLKCHALDEPKHYTGELLDDRGLTDGVSCDSCHGPSAKWNSLHYQSWWKGLSDREKFDQFGFIPTKDPVARVLNCAQCHVGGRDREVNHDLIAAGHPRLSFEYTRYHFSEAYANKHWEEKVPNPEFEVRAWLVGQAASLRAATDLLAARAERAETNSAPWPEFAESSCYACHQNLGAELRSHTTNAHHPRKSGVLGWQLWYASLSKALPKLAGIVVPGSKGPALASLDPLRIEMEKPVPNAKTVAELAKQATAQLDAWLISFQTNGSTAKLSPEQLKALASTIAESAYDNATGKLRDYDWDVLAQHALAFTAVYHAAGGAGNPAMAAWTAPLTDIRAKLAFPKAGGRVDSPRGFKPDSVYPGFKKLYELTR